MKGTYRKLTLFLLCLLAATCATFAQSGGGVGIGTTTPDTSSILDLNSTTSALLLPRIGNARLNSMMAKEGMLAYGSDTSALMVFGKGSLETMVSYMNPTQSGPNGSSWSPTTGVYYGQNYIPAATFTLSTINLACVANTGTTNFMGNVAISGPGIAALTTVTNPPIITSTSQQKMVSADFSGSSITLQAGQTYQISFRFASIPSGFSFRFYSTPVYSGGAFQGTGGSLGLELTGRRSSWWPAATPSNLPSLLTDYVGTGTAQTISGLKTFTNGKIRMMSGTDTVSSSGNLVLQVNDDNSGNDSLVFVTGSNTNSRQLLRISSNGNASVNGSVNAASVTTTASGTGSANMLAVAYGNVDGISSTLVVNKSSGNFTVVHNSTGVYTITFSASSPLANQNIDGLPITVSLVDFYPGLITWYGNQSGPSYMIVHTFNPGGAPADKHFTFVVYNP